MWGKNLKGEYRMSLLGSATLANIDTPYYSGGGGGAATSTFVTASISTLNVSSIIGNGPGGALELSAPGAIFLNAGSGAAVELTSAGRIDFGDSLGRLTGVSSINGAAYPPPGAAASVSTSALSAVTIGDAPAVLNNNFSPGLTAGQSYMGSIVLDSASISVIGQPNEGDHVAVYANTTAAGTIDLVSLSSMKGKGQPLGFSYTTPFTAISGAGGLQFVAYCNAGSAASTILGSDYGAVWATPM
jgi:hypothetical protein